MRARILIIEDIVSDAKLLELEVLKYNPDFVIKITDSLEQMKKELNEFKPNVILSDFDLKYFNAFHILRHLKNSKLNIPCIVVTGVINDEETVAQLILEGAVGFIQKKDLSHIRTSLKRVFDSVNSSFDTNFDIYESKLKLLFKIREMQCNFNNLAIDTPEIARLNEDFIQFTEQMIVEIKSSYTSLPLLSRNDLLGDTDI